MLVEFARIFFSFLVFFYASYYDLKERIVPNKGWLIIYPVAVSVNVLSFYLERNLQDVAISMFSIFIAMVVGLLCFYSGFLGGGDVKTFIAVSLLCPTFIFNSQSLFSPFLPLSTIVNSIFLLLMISLYFFVKNVFKIVKGERIFEGFEREPLWRKLLAVAIGYKVCGKIDWKFFRVIEKRIGEKRLFYFSDSNSDEVVCLGEVWASPIIPFVVLMFLGFTFSLFFGDILTIIIRFVGIT